MFHLTLSPNISKIFEGFCILKKQGDVKCLYSYPSNYSFQRFYDFIFPCNCPKERSEEYCLVTSNASNDRCFLICRYSDVHQLYLCIYSHNPWFEILSKLLFNLCHNEFMPNKVNAIRSYLQQVLEMDEESHVTLPACNANDNRPQCILKNSMKYPYIYDKYIQEYLTAITPSSGYNKQLWLEVFWGMLLERPIIFMSKRYQKLTSSLLAATFFIHPLSWLHKFVSIIPQKNPQLLGMNCCMLGIHSCMEPVLENTEFWNEALLVDLDKGDSRMVGASENHKETQSRFKIPKYIRNFFISHIQLVDENVSNNSPNRIKDLISTTPWHLNKEETMYNGYKRGFHIYSILFRTIISMIIGNYRQFICIQNDRYEFEKEKFIQSNPKLTEFLKIFVQSQCFDSFIEDKLKGVQSGKDMEDRFDTERQEMPSNNKIPNKKIKENKKPRKIKDKLSKTAFQAKSLSLSSSTSSINSNNLSRENILEHIESSNDKNLKVTIERRRNSDRDQPRNLSPITCHTIVHPGDRLMSPTFDKLMVLEGQQNDGKTSNRINQIPVAKPVRPIFKPGETPSGLVQSLIQQINDGKLEGNLTNNNRKKSNPAIKSSELPPSNKPVSKLTSMFEAKGNV